VTAPPEPWIARTSSRRHGAGLASAAMAERRRGARERLVGIDLGGTKIEGVVLGADWQVLFRKRVATEQEGGYAHILARVAALAAELRERAPECRSIGIGTPGSISSRDGRIKNSNTVCLNGQPLREDLAARLGLEVATENDANCFALAEAVAGSGRGHEMVFGVILGTGVGGGIAFRNELWTGPQHIAGEWGHHAIDPAGPDCYCGQRGCVESLISGPALERDYREAGGDGDVAQIAQRARRGEARASAVIDRYVLHFGRALANLIAILDPSVVVLGGGLSNLDFLYTRGRDAVARAIFNDELTTPIVRNALGDSAGVIGAAALTAVAKS
jgi:fructokinase